MNTFIENLTSLGSRRLIALGVTGFGLVLAVFFGVSAVLAPSFVALYNDLSPASASRIVTTLEQAGFKVKLSGSGAEVSVPRESIARARMALADSGLPSEGTPGWELFDQASGLGMNSFMMKINRLRALEGELARSIQSIDGVEAARVHLVLPEREAFSRNKPTPSASVIVRSRAGSQLSRRRALAIRALVSSAVAEMLPSQVTILSASGETILSDAESGGGGITLETIQTGIEERLSRSISSILTARVGAGNARVQVAVSLTSESQVITQQVFDPEQQVVRSVETSEENSSDSASAGGTVDIGNNLPGAGAGGGPSSDSAQTTEVVNYEIGSTSTRTIREPGDIERISVAVLINGIRSTDADGVVSVVDRPPEELERLRQLVRSAVGFDAARGDSITIDSLQFIDYNDDLSAPIGRSLTQVLSDNLMSILRGVFALVLVGAVLMFGLRPALSLVLAAPAVALPGAAAGALAAPDMAAVSAGIGAAALPGPPAAALSAMAPGLNAGMHADAVHPGVHPGGVHPGMAPAMAPNMVPGMNPGMAPGMNAGMNAGMMVNPNNVMDGELITLASVAGGVQRQRINSIGALAEKEPEESLKVMQYWLAEED